MLSSGFWSLGELGSIEAFQSTFVKDSAASSLRSSEDCEKTDAVKIGQTKQYPREMVRPLYLPLVQLTICLVGLTEAFFVPRPTPIINDRVMYLNDRQEHDLRRIVHQIRHDNNLIVRNSKADGSDEGESSDNEETISQTQTTPTSSETTAS